MGKVCTEAGPCFDTIAAAMAAQPEGGVLVVEAGEYLEVIAPTASYELHGQSDGLDGPMLHSPGGGAPIIALTGAVDLLVSDVAFHATSGRVFEVTDGATLRLVGTALSSSAARSLGAVGYARGASLTLDRVRITGGVAQHGTQLYAEDVELLAFGLDLDRGIATDFGGALIALVDADGSPDFARIQVLDVADSSSAGAAVATSGGELACDTCRFDGFVGTAIVSSGSHVDVSNGDFAGVGRALDASGGGRVVVEGSRFEGTRAAVLAMGVDAVTIGRSVFVDVENPLTLNATETTIVGDLFCGVSTPVPERPADSVRGAVLLYSYEGGSATVANSRFVASTGPVLLNPFSLVPPGGRVDLRHNDFFDNTTQRLVLSEMYDGSVTARDAFVDNVVTGHRGATALIAGTALGELATNLVDDNAGAILAEGRDGGAIEGFDGMLEDPRATCDAIRARTGAWASAPWPTWRYAGRDAGSGAPDPDGSPSDVGSLGGPLAAEYPWDDFDRDGWPRAYDCDDLAPHYNGDVVDDPYDGIDADCDGYSDADDDLDFFDAVAEGGDDCDDGDALVNPAAIEIVNDAIDQDCDGDIDLDDDGYAWPADCDDTRAERNPSQVEDPGGLDRDCDGLVDARGALGFGCATSPGSALGLLLAFVAARGRVRRGV